MGAPAAATAAAWAAAAAAVPVPPPLPMPMLASPPQLSLSVLSSSSGVTPRLQFNFSNAFQIQKPAQIQPAATEWREGRRFDRTQKKFKRTN
jgi:hypothetical protein